jgi:hypothetical protein
VSDLSAIVHLRDGVDTAQGRPGGDAVDWPDALKKYRAFLYCEAIMHKLQHSLVAAPGAACFFLKKGR